MKQTSQQTQQKQVPQTQNTNLISIDLLGDQPTLQDNSFHDFLNPSSTSTSNSTSNVLSEQQASNPKDELLSLNDNFVSMSRPTNLQFQQNPTSFRSSSTSSSNSLSSPLNSPSLNSTTNTNQILNPVLLSKPSDPFSNLVADTIPQNRIDPKKLPMNSLISQNSSLLTQTTPQMNSMNQYQNNFK